ncbi:MAG TPA: aldo/keto reductase [Lachnospiraceae bacterium]|nr:aldo/keto reductase [Lachnospiraceae bacterium]
MKRNVTIPETDLVLSPMGLGAVNAGLRWDGPDADRIFDAFLDLGGNVIDTARVYSDWIPPEIGRSERAVGDWLERSGKRSRVVLVTKGGHPVMTGPHPDLHVNRVARADMEQDIDLSLKALRTDHIDIYFYHRDDQTIPVEALVDTMESFVKAGKIRYYGCSNWTTDRMKAADAYAKKMGYRGFAANQALLNLGSKYMNPLEDDTLVYVKEKMYRYHDENRGNLLMPYMGVCGGFFSAYAARGEEAVKDSPYATPENLAFARRIGELQEKYHASPIQLALGYFTLQKFPCIPLYGPRDVASLEDAAGTFDIAFERGDYEKYLY